MEDTVTTESTQPTNPRRWPWIVAVVAAWIVGLLIGIAGADADTTPAATPEPETITETVEVEVAPAACGDALDHAEVTIGLYEDLIELKGELVEITALTVAETLLDEESTFDARMDDFNVRQDALIDVKDEALEAFVVAGGDCDPDWLMRTPVGTEEEPVEEEPAEEAPETSGEYTAGNYVFADVQVGRDFADDFEVRARVTNTGSSRELVLFVATIFKDGTVVGTADGVVDGFDAGDTVTISFFSLDDYTDWDEIEFQVDAEM